MAEDNEETSEVLENEVEPLNNTDSDTAQEKKAKKKGKKKWPIALGVVAVVLVAAGAGFMVWHEQPSFCNAICHTPMDAYNATYEEGTTDKFGNEMSEAERCGMMAYQHKEVEGMACLDCHKPVLSEQIAEGIHWVTGDYVTSGKQSNGSEMVYLPKRTLTELTEAREIAPEAFCMNESCHLNEDGSVMTYEDLPALTADLSDTRNPHVFQHGKYDCGVCHQAHAQSVNFCSSCHPEDSPIPEGWLSVAEAKQIQR